MAVSEFRRLFFFVSLIKPEPQTPPAACLHYECHETQTQPPYSLPCIPIEPPNSPNQLFKPKVPLLGGCEHGELLFWRFPPLHGDLRHRPHRPSARRAPHGAVARAELLVL